MIDELYLASAPIGEECAQVGSDDYSERSKKECDAFIKQIIREHGAPPNGAFLKIKHCPHDFGTYLDIVVRFNDENEVATEYAYKVEANLPEYWDEEAKKELNITN